MKISIIIPVLNEADGIEQTLRDLSATINGTCEVIVVDGGSEDDTFTLAQPLVDTITNTKGRALQMNAGAELASGQVLLFLHSDTRLPENFHAISQAITAAQWGFFTVRLSGQSLWFRLIARMMNLRSRLTHVATGDQCLFVSRQLFNQLGGYADIPLMEDVELCKRLRQHYSPVVIKSKVTTSSRRWEKNGIIKTILLMWRLRLEYFLGISPHKLAARYYS